MKFSLRRTLADLGGPFSPFSACTVAIWICIVYIYGDACFYHPDVAHSLRLKAFG